MHAHTHNEIHKGIVGSGKGLGPTPVVLCFTAKKNTTNGTGCSHQVGAHDHTYMHIGIMRYTRAKWVQVKG